jgi:TrmH family RNA methyltransferase
MRKLTGLEEAAGVKVVAELALPAFVDLMAASQQDSGGEASGKSAVLPGPCRQLQRLLVLEGVQDPGNLGTLLRCATAFGWDAVWLLPGCADPFNDKALRASRGAALRCPMAVGSFEQLLAVVESRNMLLLAAEPENQQPHQQKHSNSSSGSVINSASRPVCLVLGTEGAGLSQQVLTAATPLSVPMVGRMESLNVGVAGAILMFALSDGGLEQLWSRLHQLRLS